MKRISVCITHYDRPHKLAATLESLARQSRAADEVFLWDDCSPRDPSDVAAQYQGRFKRFVFHRNKKNLGMPGNLNAVLSQATGDYIANLHDADVFDERLLEKWANALDAYPSAGMVFCGLDATKDNAAGAHLVLPDASQLTDGREFFDRWFVGCQHSAIWGTVMARQSAYEKLLPLDAKYRNWADVDLWMRMCAKHDIAYIREPLIILDNTPTPQRRFSWYRVLLMQEMIFMNIRRIYGNDSSALSKAILRQRRCMMMSYARLLAGSLRWVDLPRFGLGLKLAARVFRSDASLGDGRLIKGLEPVA